MYDWLDPLVDRYAQMFGYGARTPVLKRPSDIGMEYDEVFFSSLDGVPLEASRLLDPANC